MPETLLITLGIILIMLGLFLLVFWMITRSVQEGAGINKKETDKRSALIVIILAIVLMILALIFLKSQ